MIDPGIIIDLAHRYTDAWCSGDPEQVAACYAPDGWLQINGGESDEGREAIAARARAFMSEFPDLTVELVRLENGDYNDFYYYWTLTGTSRAGRPVKISGQERWRLKDGLIAASEGSFDAADFARQLGSEPSS